MKRLQRWAGLTAGLGLGISLAWGDPLVYVSNSHTDTVAVVNAATRDVVEVLEMSDLTDAPEDIKGMALSPDRETLYLGNFAGLDVDSRDVPAGEGSIVEVGNFNHVLLVNEAGTLGYGLGSLGIDVYDLENRTLLESKIDYPEGEGLPEMVLSPDESRIYVVGIEGTVEVFHTGHQDWIDEPITVEGWGDVGSSFVEAFIALAPDGSRLYFTYFDPVPNSEPHGRVAIIDTVTGDLLGDVIEVGQSTGAIVLSPDGDRAYIADYKGDSVLVLDTRTHTLIDEVEVDANPYRSLALNSTGTRLFVGNSTAGSLSVIDTEALETLGDPIDLRLAGEMSGDTGTGSSIEDIVVGSASPDIVALAVDPAYPMNLYAGTDGAGLYRSVDGGANWEQANNGVTDVRITELAITPDGGAVYAGTHSGGVFKSTDYGASWWPVNLGLSTAVRALEVAPDDDQTVYVGVAGGAGVYTSTNGGASWEQSSEGLPDEFVD